MTEEHDTDEDLQTRFDELRRTETQPAPPFDATWEAAARKVKQQRRRRTALFVGAAGLAAAAALLLFLVSSLSPSAQVSELESDHALTSAASRAPSPTALPTEFLMAAPMSPAVELELGVDPFRYQLERLLAEQAHGVEQ